MAKKTSAARTKTAAKPHRAKPQAKVQVDRGQDRRASDLNPVALRPMYDTLRECGDALLHHPELSRKISSALALADSK